jgi:predicted KAP-like P-loop ATPase
MNSINADKPVLAEIEDRFQRYDFSKRIAKSIVGRKSQDCIVIGIYGAWGEGKTSVINFVEGELKQEENIIIIKFNPWRYNDEHRLLEVFFNTLAKALNKSLKNNKEKAGDLIKKYGKSVAPFSKFIPVVGEAVSSVVESIGEMIADDNVEELKEKVDKIIKESGKRILVLIDDIDRLDKQEVYSVFRLVKLTADFANTTYLLSFDDSMVASAIGERFGEGNQSSGFNFLEKIIQVPLRIPVAQPEALKKYCFELVDKAITESGIIISQDEASRFVREFTQNILLSLKTPRLAVRYANSLSFALPLLKDEVNHIDLMLIEAVKIFFPMHYQFVKNYPDYFIGAYSSQSLSSYNYDNKQEKIKEISEHLDRIGNELTKNEKKAIKEILTDLFPRLNEAFHNYSHHDETYNKWFKDKRIVSYKYFSRYFSYSVIEGDISDIVFSEFINKIESSNVTEVSSSLNKLISQSSPDNFLHKLRSHEDEYKWEVAEKLAEAIGVNGDFFPQNDSFFSFGFDSPKGQAGIFVYQLLKHQNDIQKRFELAKKLMLVSQPFDFACSINNWLRSGKEESEKIFTPPQYQELALLLINRAIEESQGLPIFEKFQDNITYLIASWSEINKIELEKYIKSEFEKSPKSCLNFLVAFTPTMRSSAYPEPYKSDFSKDQYDFLKNIVDVEIIKNAVLNHYQKEIEKEDVVFSGHMENLQSEINILRQFVHWNKFDSQNPTGNQ